MKKQTAMMIVAAAGVMAATASADVLSGSNSAVLEWGSGFNSTGDPVPNTDGEVTLFPSDIALSGAANMVIKSISVTLHDGAHTWSDDMEITLMAANGSVVTLMQDAGGNDNIAGDLTFSTASLDLIADGGTDVDYSGTFGASIYGTAVGTPAPAADALFTDLIGSDANGTWTLFVFDDAGGDTGSFAGGWSIEIETSPVPAPASVALLGLGGLVMRRRR